MPSVFSFVASLCLLAQVADPAAMEKAVLELGHDDFAVREQAMKNVAAFGDPAIPLLEKAAESDDPEVRFRAKILINDIRLGLTADMPEELRTLIARFHQPNADKADVIRRLSALAAWKQIKALLNLEADPTVRNMLQNIVAGQANTRLAQCLEQNRDDEARMLLEMSVVSDFQRSRLVLFLHAKSALDEYVQPLRARLERKYPEVKDVPAALAALDPKARAKSDPDVGLLLLALQVQGRSDEAAHWALRGGDAAWVEHLARLRGDWRMVAFSQKKRLGKSGNMREYAPALVQAHLGGDREELERLAALSQPVPLLSPVNSQSQLPAGLPTAKAHLLAERVEAGLAQLRPPSRHIAAELLAMQRRYEEALALLRVAGAEPITAASLDAALGDPVVPQSREMEFLNHCVTAVNLLMLLGEKDRAIAVRDALRMRGKSFPEGQKRFFQIRMWEMELLLAGEEDRDVVAAMILPDMPDRGFSLPVSLFREQAPTAGFWWTYLGHRTDPMPKGDRLAWIRRVLAPATSDNAPKEWKALVEQAAAESPADVAAASYRLAGLAQTAVMRGDWELALRLREQQAALIPTARILVGDLHVQRENWEGALAAYEQTAKNTAQQLEAEYLLGIVCAKLGRAEESVRHEQRALTLACHSPFRLTTLAALLAQRNFNDEAAEIHELLLRLSTPDQPVPSNTIQFLGNRASRYRDPQAIRYWEQLCVCLAEPNTTVSDPKAYLDLPLLVRRARGRDLLAQGKTAAAVAEFEAAVKLVPCHVATYERIIPLLDKADAKADADRMFADGYERFAALCEKYPKSGQLRNELAWMSARCRRRLPEALALAEAATKLQPHRAAFVDTLAETYFQLERRDEAIATAKKCLAMEPENEFFAKQLKRFETGTPGVVEESEP